MKLQHAAQQICLALGTLCLPVANADSPCNLWQDVQGFWHSDCALEDLQVDSGAVFQPRMRLLLPNLRVKKFYYEVYHASVLVKAKIQNVGNKDVAVPFDYEGSLYLVDHDTGMPVRRILVNDTIDGLAVGEQKMIYMGMFNETGPFYVSSSLTVDPPSFRAPGGKIWESNETDNSRLDTCAYFPEDYEPQSYDPEPCY